MTSRKPYEYQAVLCTSGLALDEGDWLRPLMSGVASTLRSLPEARTVARIRETVLERIERESVPLVA